PTRGRRARGPRTSAAGEGGGRTDGSGQATASGAVWALIQATQRAQLDDEPGVRLPSSRAPAAPVAAATLAGTPSTVSAASVPAVSALRASAGPPRRPVRARGRAPPGRSTA